MMMFVLYPRSELAAAVRASNCRGRARVRRDTRSDFPQMTFLLLLLKITCFIYHEIDDDHMW